MMLQCPKKLQKIYKFQQDGKLFVADLVRCQVLEINELTWQFLEMCPSFSNEAIVSKLSSLYPANEIQSVFERLASFEEAGLLFCSETESEAVRLNDRPRYLCPNPMTFFADIRHNTGGYYIALHYLIKALGASYADVDICRSKSEILADGVHGIPFHFEEPAFFAHLLHENYQGIFLSDTSDTFIIPYLRFLPIPVIVPLYILRGHSGYLTNEIFLWYSAFRDCDAFVVPSESVKSFYSQYLLDENCFYVSHYGVDHELFHPMDKELAKREVAQMLGDERIIEKPIVGFLSRLQPEKGGGTYLQIAHMIPEALFVAVSPLIPFYEDVPKPDNFIYAGPQPREKLPLFFNAFDIHCFPSVVEEETFGMVALEAMACGTPVVASNFNGIPEVVGDTGVLVPTETYLIF